MTYFTIYFIVTMIISFALHCHLLNFALDDDSVIDSLLFTFCMNNT